MKQTVFHKVAGDVALCATLVVGYIASLLRSTQDLGYARDEGFYFQAADAYLTWFREYGAHGREALKRSVVDQYWQVNHEHPALVKSLFAASRFWLYDKWRLFERPGTSYRFVGMCFAGLALATIFVWARRAIPARSLFHSRVAASVATLAFGLMPRIFYHSHLDCFDIPVLSMWCFTCYVYWESVRTRSWWLALVTGVLYGLLLNTKHNSWLLPIALVGHWLVCHLSGLGRFFRPRLPPALFAMALLGPLVFYATWPWIWFDTLGRLREYVLFHTQHVYYNMEFLGKTYFRPPFPRSYAWVMTAATVPAVTLLLSTLGIFGALGTRLRACVRGIQSVRTAGIKALFLPPAEASPTTDFEVTQLLWLVGVVINYAPWLSNQNPIFGGTKHWTTAYPFLALFAGVGFLRVGIALEDLASDKGWLTRRAARPALQLALAASVLLAPWMITRDSHPWGLSSYTPLVGSAPGAASLGLNRTFWGYTTGSVAKTLNQISPEQGRTFIHDTAFQSWYMMRADGTVRQDLRPQIEVSGSDVGVYHHEQHMSLVEYQIWTDYGTAQPTAIGAHQGVPVVWVYRRPD